MKRKEASLVGAYACCPLVLKAAGIVIMALIFSKHGCITLNVIDLANTLHALGSSAYSVREVL